MRAQLLRDLKRNTELLILIELLERPSIRYREIAERLDITVQAVSQYIAAMRKEGFIKDQAGAHRPTRKGMQILQEHFSDLKLEIDATLRRIRVIDTCEAIAGKKVEKGQSLGLVMEDGMLFAYPGLKSESAGIALEDADEGDDVRVGQLEGIVDLELGRLLVIEVPSEHEGGSKKADIPRAKEEIDEFSPGLLVAGDVVGAAILMKTSGELYTIHAPVESSMSALSRGVDVVFAGTKDSADRLLEQVSLLKKESGYEIKCRTFRA